MPPTTGKPMVAMDFDSLGRYFQEFERNLDKIHEPTPHRHTAKHRYAL